MNFARSFYFLSNFFTSELYRGIHDRLNLKKPLKQKFVTNYEKVYELKFSVNDVEIFKIPEKLRNFVDTAFDVISGCSKRCCHEILFVWNFPGTPFKDINEVSFKTQKRTESSFFTWFLRIFSTFSQNVIEKCSLKKANNNPWILTTWFIYPKQAMPKWIINHLFSPLSYQERWKVPTS